MVLPHPPAALPPAIKALSHVGSACLPGPCCTSVCSHPLGVLLGSKGFALLTDPDTQEILFLVVSTTRSSMLVLTFAIRRCEFEAVCANFPQDFVWRGRPLLCCTVFRRTLL